VLLLSVVKSDAFEGTGRQVERAGVADVIGGQGSDEFQVSSTSAWWVIQALLTRDLGSRHCESVVLLVHVHLLCRQLRNHHNRVDGRKQILAFTSE
jgi:hypothetical protein